MTRDKGVGILAFIRVLNIGQELTATDNWLWPTIDSRLSWQILLGSEKREEKNDDNLNIFQHIYCTLKLVTEKK